MGVFETLSKRQKKLKTAGQPDVYQYDTLPNEFRVQVVHILRSSIGHYDPPHPYVTRSEIHYPNNYWELIHNTMAREIGTFNLGKSGYNPEQQSEQFILSTDTAGVLDIIELSFKVIDQNVRHLNPYEAKRVGITQSPDHAIDELNARFHEHSIGYQFEAGQLVRLDSQYIHAEVVKPAIALLQEVSFRGATDEFLRAHKHYREGNTKEAVGEALKAFESTMKAICDARKLPYAENVTAKGLIDIIFKQGLVSPEMQSHFDSLRSVMESGLPTLRNKSTSAHGQGAVPVTIPDHIAAYALHLAATNIVLLVRAHKASR